MTDKCPYDCWNKTEYGYCKTTGCINPAYQFLNFRVVDYGRVLSNDNSPCANCPNNPINGGSGICHCILGTPKIY